LKPARLCLQKFCHGGWIDVLTQPDGGRRERSGELKVSGEGLQVADHRVLHQAGRIESGAFSACVFVDASQAVLHV